jgi:hypothetical protein
MQHYDNENINTLKHKYTRTYIIITNKIIIIFKYTITIYTYILTNHGMCC